QTCALPIFTTRERVLPQSGQKSSLKQDLSDLVKNKPWRIVLLITILVFLTLSLKGGMYIYYFENYLSESHLAAFLENIGFNGFIQGLNNTLTGMGLTEFKWPKDAPTSAFSLFNAGGIICMVIGIGFSKSLADKFGKRDVFGGGLLLATIFL